MIGSERGVTIKRTTVKNQIVPEFLTVGAIVSKPLSGSVNGGGRILMDFGFYFTESASNLHISVHTPHPTQRVLSI